MVAVVAAVVAAPLALSSTVPDPPKNRIGVYERVTLRGTANGEPVLAGFIAPRGWFWVGDRSSGSYAAPGDAVAVSVSLRTDVSDPEALLREALPVGAAALPVESSPVAPSPADSRLMQYAVEYDLGAGDATSLLSAVCTREARANCVLVTADFADVVLDESASDASGASGLGALDPADEELRDRARAELARMLDSTEVVA
ncbi:MAG: hypothetical protein ACK5LO_02755 [Leucobacter sp.]